MPEGSENVNIGEPIAIVVENKDDIPAFASVTKESLEGRSLDSIKDSILDLKEEMNGQGAKPEIKIQEAQDPTLKSNKNTNVDVKKNKKESNIDLREGLEKIMNSLII